MRYVIIGGVAGGATAAARLRRMDEQAEIILIEKGSYVSYANCGLPYYIGNTIPERNSLFLQTPTTLGNRFDLDVRIRTEVTAINRDAKTVSCRNLVNGKEYTERYDKLVLSPGTVAVRPNLPGIDAPGIFTLKDVPDTDAIKSYLTELTETQKEAVIIGAGFIGLEMAENLHRLGCHVTIVEKAGHIMPVVDWEIAAIVQKHLADKGVTVLTNNGVSRFEREGDRNLVILEDGQKLPTDLVLVSIGVKPLTKLAVGAGLEIGTLGGIRVNKQMQTSDPDIYAVGDAVETVNPITGKSQLCFLAGPTNKQARLCADNIVEGNCHEYGGAIGTAIAKVFDLTIGSTGLSEQALKREGLPYLTSITHTGSNATYYPGSWPVSIKIQFDPATGRLYGAAVCGKGGADKRLDLLASVIAHGGTVHDLTDFDHAYAPPFSSAKDPVTVAGYVAENILTHKTETIQWHELKEMLANKADSDFLLIDVRSFLECKAGVIEGSVNYPLDELREYLEDIPTDVPIVIYCAIGLRGYIATRILKQNGFDNVRNLAGGYKTWTVCAPGER